MNDKETETTATDRRRDRKTEENRKENEKTEKDRQPRTEIKNDVEKEEKFNTKPVSIERDGEEKTMSQGPANQEKKENEDGKERKNLKVEATSSKKPSKGRYFLAAEIKGEIVPILVDTGADISLAPFRFRDSGILSKLSYPFNVKGYDGRATTTIKETTTLEIDFKISKFYLTHVEFIIVGADLLRDSREKVSLNTKTDEFKISNVTMTTKSTPTEAIREWENRNEKTKTVKPPITWATIKSTKRIPARSAAAIEITSRQVGDTFISNLDDENEKIYIPSVSLCQLNDKLTNIIQNRTDRDIVKGTPVEGDSDLLEDLNCPISPTYSFLILLP